MKIGIIDDLEMMTHILPNLFEEYESIIENLEYEIYNNIYPLIIYIIRDKLQTSTIE